MGSIQKIILSVLLILLLSACAVSAVDSKNSREMITLIGTIRLVGNEPFTHLVITTDDSRDYLIKGRFEKELRKLQYQRVEIKGENLLPSNGFKYCIDVKEYKIIVIPK
jgi:hypothetical protein